MGSIRLVVDLSNREGVDWNEELIKSIFNEDDAKLILDIPWPITPCEDKILWCDNNSKGFSVKISYLINSIHSEETSELWGKLWKLKIYDRLKLFLWRVMAGVIPTREMMFYRIGS